MDGRTAAYETVADPKRLVKAGERLLVAAGRSQGTLRCSDSRRAGPTQVKSTVCTPGMVRQPYRHIPCVAHQRPELHHNH